MRKADMMLTRSAKKLADDIKDYTGMNLKLIMSAGVFAFANMTHEKRLEYISRAQLGEFRDQPDVKYIPVTKQELQLISDYRLSSAQKDEQSESAADSIVDERKPRPTFGASKPPAGVK